MKPKFKEVTVSDKAIFVDGVPACFALRLHSLEHMDGWVNTPLDVNLEGDAYASAAGEEHGNDAIINYDCLAWE